MRILFLSWRDTTHPDGGGAERYLEQIAFRLAAAGDEVTVLCADHGRAPRDEVVRGVRFLRRGGRLTVYLRGLALVASRTGRRQDVVVDVVNGMPFGAPLLRRRGMVALVHHLHREQWRLIYPGTLGAAGWFVESRLTPRVHRRSTWVTVSNSTRTELVGLGVSPGDIAVVRNGADPRATNGSRSPTPRLAVLGRLVPHKRVEDALDVVAALQPEVPDLTLDVIGDGWWRARLDAHRRRIGLTTGVRFHGTVPDQVRDDLLARSWALLVPSVKEGWSIAVVEAAAAGTPAVAYLHGGGVNESVLHDRTGLLVADKSAMIAATRQLLTDDALRERLSVAARLRVCEFSWDDTAAAFRAVLETAATGGGSALPVLDRLAAGRVVIGSGRGGGNDTRDGEVGERGPYDRGAER